MSVDKKTLIGTIDLTPTWEQQARDCIEIIKDREHRSIEVVEAATDEIIRMGTLLDQRQGSTSPILDPHNVLALERGTQDGYFKDDTERWFNVDIIGSQYEQQTSTKRNWRYRPIYTHQLRPEDWIDGRAPDVKLMALEISETDWPLSYNDHGLLIGPLRMCCYNDVWVYCWDDPGVKERVNEQCRAVIDAHQKDTL